MNQEYQLWCCSKTRERREKPKTRGSRASERCWIAMRSMRRVSAVFLLASGSSSARRFDSSWRRVATIVGTMPLENWSDKPVALWHFQAWISNPTPDGTVTRSDVSTSTRYKRMTNWKSRSRKSDRTERPLRDLFFRQKLMSDLKARNSKRRWSTLASRVTPRSWMLVSLTRRRTSSMSVSENPSSVCVRSESCMDCMRRCRAGAMGEKDSWRGSAPTVSLRGMYLSDVRPISSTCKFGM
mmetsp:Transcript_3206/g.9296  ORF Transcript_3206/g.9296 Transcript_3206/m.9296 type:complete len:240 (+) Transcript_3206:281-1000(+)